MGKANRFRLGGRPVFIADYQAPARTGEIGGSRGEATVPAGTGTPAGPNPLTAPATAPAPAAANAIRHHFPAAGEEREGGCSDGYCYRVTFAAGRLERTYEMVVAFLREQGYGDLPLPADTEELRRFRLPPKLRHQLSFFGDNGYVHNPVKVLFPVPAGNRGALIVELYDERNRDHLLRFHRLK